MGLRLAELSTALLTPPPFFARYGEALRAIRRLNAPRPANLKESDAPAVSIEVMCLRTDTENTSRLEVSGVLAAQTAAKIWPVFDAVVAANKRCVTLDLDGLTMLDSSGVAAMVSLFKRVTAAGGVLLVEGVHGQPLAILKLLKLESVFGI